MTTSLRYICGGIFFILMACSTAPFSGQQDYEKAINAKSAGDKQFAGLYHNFEYRATLLTHSILKTINQRMTKLYSWDEASQSSEYGKLTQQSASHTRVFMSFFTPSSKNDNLDSSSSIWKIYLHIDGQRYEGKVRKTSLNLSEAMAVYPYHTRWATPYYVDFPVTTSAVNQGTVRLVVTGPLGQREVTFP